MSKVYAVNVILCSNPVVPIVLMRRGASRTPKQITQSSLRRLARVCRDLTAMGKGKCYPFNNGWSFERKV